MVIEPKPVEYVPSPPDGNNGGNDFTTNANDSTSKRTNEGNKKRSRYNDGANVMSVAEASAIRTTIRLADGTEVIQMIPKNSFMPPATSVMELSGTSDSSGLTQAPPPPSLMVTDSSGLTQAPPPPSLMVSDSSGLTQAPPPPSLMMAGPSAVVNNTATPRTSSPPLPSIRASELLSKLFGIKGRSSRSTKGGKNSKRRQSFGWDSDDDDDDDDGSSRNRRHRKKADDDDEDYEDYIGSRFRRRHRKKDDDGEFRPPEDERDEESSEDAHSGHKRLGRRAAASAAEAYITATMADEAEDLEHQQQQQQQQQQFSPSPSQSQSQSQSPSSHANSHSYRPLHVQVAPSRASYAQTRLRQDQRSSPPPPLEQLPLVPQSRYSGLPSHPGKQTPKSRQKRAPRQKRTQQGKSQSRGPREEHPASPPPLPYKVQEGKTYIQTQAGSNDARDKASFTPKLPGFSGFPMGGFVPGLNRTPIQPPYHGASQPNARVQSKGPRAVPGTGTAGSGAPGTPASKEAQGLEPQGLPGSPSLQPKQQQKAQIFPLGPQEPSRTQIMEAKQQKQQQLQPKQQKQQQQSNINRKAQESRNWRGHIDLPEPNEDDEDEDKWVSDSVIGSSKGGYDEDYGLFPNGGQGGMGVGPFGGGQGGFGMMGFQPQMLGIGIGVRSGSQNGVPQLYYSGQYQIAGTQQQQQQQRLQQLFPAMGFQQKAQQYGAVQEQVPSQPGLLHGVQMRAYPAAAPLQSQQYFAPVQPSTQSSSVDPSGTTVSRKSQQQQQQPYFVQNPLVMNFQPLDKQQQQQQEERYARQLPQTPAQKLVYQAPQDQRSVENFSQGPRLSSPTKGENRVVYKSIPSTPAEEAQRGRERKYPDDSERDQNSSTAQTTPHSRKIGSLDAERESRNEQEYDNGYGQVRGFDRVDNEYYEGKQSLPPDMERGRKGVGIDRAQHTIDQQIQGATQILSLEKIRMASGANHPTKVLLRATKSISAQVYSSPPSKPESPLQMPVFHQIQSPEDNNNNNNNNVPGLALLTPELLPSSTSTASDKAHHSRSPSPSRSRSSSPPPRSPPLPPPPTKPPPKLNPRPSTRPKTNRKARTKTQTARAPSSSKIPEGETEKGASSPAAGKAAPLSPPTPSSPSTPLAADGVTPLPPPPSFSSTPSEAVVGKGSLSFMLDSSVSPLSSSSGSPSSPLSDPELDRLSSEQDMEMMSELDEMSLEALRDPNLLRVAQNKMAEISLVAANNIINRCKVSLSSRTKYLIRKAGLEDQYDELTRKGPTADRRDLAGNGAAASGTSEGGPQDKKKGGKRNRSLQIVLPESTITVRSKAIQRGPEELMGAQNPRGRRKSQKISRREDLLRMVIGQRTQQLAQFRQERYNSMIQFHNQQMARQQWENQQISEAIGDEMDGLGTFQEQVRIKGPRYEGIQDESSSSSSSSPSPSPSPAPAPLGSLSPSSPPLPPLQVPSQKPSEPADFPVMKRPTITMRDLERSSYPSSPGKLGSAGLPADTSDTLSAGAENAPQTREPPNLAPGRPDKSPVFTPSSGAEGAPSLPSSSSEPAALPQAQAPFAGDEPVRTGAEERLSPRVSPKASGLSPLITIPEDSPPQTSARLSSPHILTAIASASPPPITTSLSPLMAESSPPPFNQQQQQQQQQQPLSPASFQKESSSQLTAEAAAEAASMCARSPVISLVPPPPSFMVNKKDDVFINDTRGREFGKSGSDDDDDDDDDDEYGDDSGFEPPIAPEDLLMGMRTGVRMGMGMGMNMGPAGGGGGESTNKNTVPAADSLSYGRRPEGAEVEERGEGGREAEQPNPLGPLLGGDGSSSSSLNSIMTIAGMSLRSPRDLVDSQQYSPSPSPSPSPSQSPTPSPSPSSSRSPPPVQLQPPETGLPPPPPALLPLKLVNPEGSEPEGEEEEEEEEEEDVIEPPPSFVPISLDKYPMQHRQASVEPNLPLIDVTSGNQQGSEVRPSGQAQATFDFSQGLRPLPIQDSQRLRISQLMQQFIVAERARQAQEQEEERRRERESQKLQQRRKKKKQRRRKRGVYVEKEIRPLHVKQVQPFELQSRSFGREPEPQTNTQGTQPQEEEEEDPQMDLLQIQFEQDFLSQIQRAQEKLLEKLEEDKRLEKKEEIKQKRLKRRIRKELWDKGFYDEFDETEDGDDDIYDDDYEMSDGDAPKNEAQEHQQMELRSKDAQAGEKGYSRSQGFLFSPLPPILELLESEMRGNGDEDGVGGIYGGVAAGSNMNEDEAEDVYEDVNAGNASDESADDDDEGKRRAEKASARKEGGHRARGRQKGTAKRGSPQETKTATRGDGGKSESGKAAADPSEPSGRPSSGRGPRSAGKAGGETRSRVQTRQNSSRDDSLPPPSRYRRRRGENRSRSTSPLRRRSSSSPSTSDPSSPELFVYSKRRGGNRKTPRKSFVPHSPEVSPLSGDSPPSSPVVLPTTPRTRTSRKTPRKSFVPHSPEVSPLSGDSSPPSPRISSITAPQKGRNAKKMFKPPSPEISPLREHSGASSSSPPPKRMALRRLSKRVAVPRCPEISPLREHSDSSPSSSPEIFVRSSKRKSSRRPLGIPFKPMPPEVSPLREHSDGSLSSSPEASPAHPKRGGRGNKRRLGGGDGGERVGKKEAARRPVRQEDAPPLRTRVKNAQGQKVVKRKEQRGDDKRPHPHKHQIHQKLQMKLRQTKEKDFQTKVHRKEHQKPQPKIHQKEQQKDHKKLQMKLRPQHAQQKEQQKPRIKLHQRKTGIKIRQKVQEQQKPRVRKRKSIGIYVETMPEPKDPFPPDPPKKRRRLSRGNSASAAEPPSAPGFVLDKPKEGLPPPHPQIEAIDDWSDVSGDEK